MATQISCFTSRSAPFRPFLRRPIPSAARHLSTLSIGEGSHRHRLGGTPPNQLLLRVNSSADGAPVADGTPPHAGRFFMSTSSDSGDGGSGTPSAAADFSLELLLLRLYQISGDHVPLELLRALAAGGTPTKKLVYDSAVKSDDGATVEAGHDLSSTGKLSTSIGVDSRVLNKAGNVFTFGREMVTTMAVAVSFIWLCVVKGYVALHKTLGIVKTLQEAMTYEDKMEVMKQMVRENRWFDLVVYILRIKQNNEGGSKSSDEDPKSTN